MPKQNKVLCTIRIDAELNEWLREQIAADPELTASSIVRKALREDKLKKR